MVNFFAILISAIINVAVGSFWYSPALFGSKWMKYVGLTEKDVERDNSRAVAWSYITTFVGNLIMIYALTFFLLASEAVVVWQSMVIAFWIWLGFIAVTNLNSILFERRPHGLYLINTSYYLVVLLIDSIILTVWR